MNKILDSREPTLSTGSLRLPWGPSGNWEERRWWHHHLPLRVHQLLCQGHCFAAEGHSIQKPNGTTKMGAGRLWGEGKYPCSTVQCTMVRVALSTTIVQVQSPNSQDRYSPGDFIYFLTLVFCNSVTRNPAGRPEAVLQGCRCNWQQQALMPGKDWAPLQCSSKSFSCVHLKCTQCQCVLPGLAKKSHLGSGT